MKKIVLLVLLITNFMFVEARDIFSMVASNMIEEVKEYIKNGGDINVRDGNIRETPLMNLFCWGRRDCKEMI